MEPEAGIKIWVTVDLLMRGAELAQATAAQAKAEQVAAQHGFEWAEASSDRNYIDYYLFAPTGRAVAALNALDAAGVNYGTVDFINIEPNEPAADAIKAAIKESSDYAFIV